MNINSKKEKMTYLTLIMSNVCLRWFRYGQSQDPTAGVIHYVVFLPISQLCAIFQPPAHSAYTDVNQFDTLYAPINYTGSSFQITSLRLSIPYTW